MITIDSFHLKLTIERLLQTLTEEQNKNNPIPRPPSSYMFDQPDSPQNILFEQFSDQPMRRTGSNNFAATAPLDLDGDQESQDSSLDALSIKAASLVKLVERLTHHLYLHPKLSSTFLMFFREFCTPRELLSLLAKRYDVPDLTPERIAELNYNFTRFIILFILLFILVERFRNLSLIKTTIISSCLIVKILFIRL